MNRVIVGDGDSLSPSHRVNLAGSRTRSHRGGDGEAPLHQLLDVSDDILQIAPHSSNLCLFVGIFNSLRKSEIRNAFVGGDLANPTRKFLELSASVNEDRERNGYTSRDLERYLRQLQRDSFISQYEWRLVSGFHFPRLLESVHSIGFPLSLVFFGYTMDSIGKQRVRARLAAERRRLVRSGMPSQKIRKALSCGVWWPTIPETRMLIVWYWASMRTNQSGCTTTGIGSGDEFNPLRTLLPI